MKILVIGDLHGQIPVLQFNDFDIVLFVGDACSFDYQKYIFQAMKLRRKTDKDVRFWDIVGKKKAKELVQQSVENGRKVFEWLNKLPKPVYFVPGNWDYAEQHYFSNPDPDWSFINQDLFAKITKGLDNLHNLHGKRKYFDSFAVVGYGITSGFVKDEYLQPFPGIAKRLTTTSRKPVILLSHDVPKDTKLDIIKNPNSPANGEHYGSSVARDILKKKNVIACLAGHMHEHYGYEKVFGKISLNAGFGKFAQTLIEVHNGKITKIIKSNKCKPFKY